jgi:hypothetical protein
MNHDHGVRTEGMRQGKPVIPGTDWVDSLLPFTATLCFTLAAFLMGLPVAPWLAGVAAAHLLWVVTAAIVNAKLRNHQQGDFRTHERHDD